MTIWIALCVYVFGYVIAAGVVHEALEQDFGREDAVDVVLNYMGAGLIAFFWPLLTLAVAGAWVSACVRNIKDDQQ